MKISIDGAKTFLEIFSNLTLEVALKYVNFHNLSKTHRIDILLTMDLIKYILLKICLKSRFWPR